MNSVNTIAALHQAFTQRSDSPSALAERNLARASDPLGEGVNCFLALNADAVRNAAAASDRLFVAANDARELEGITISIKDLFDVQGEVNAAGSSVLRDRASATNDAPAVARLRAAGAVLFGRSNMVEFAYSGIGINRRFGTPRNVWGRTADGGGRIPGGSTSGGGVSVADAMCEAALGSDTGGSVRIPAALNGIYGFKPTANRVPVSGAVPLSYSFDSVGPLANSIDCCARIDAVLAGTLYTPLPKLNMRDVRLLKPLGILWDELDPEVERACLAALERLRLHGARIVELPLPALEAYYSNSAHMSIVGSEAFEWHVANVDSDGKAYDSRVWQRIQLGRNMTRAQYANAHYFRRIWIERMQEALAGYDALICPTVACIAPEIATLLMNDAAFFVANTRVLRNTAWVNFMDGCGVSLPCQSVDEAPVGLQLVGTHGSDRYMLTLAAAVDTVLRG